MYSCIWDSLYSLYVCNMTVEIFDISNFFDYLILGLESQLSSFIDNNKVD